MKNDSFFQYCTTKKKLIKPSGKEKLFPVHFRPDLIQTFSFTLHTTKIHYREYWQKQSWDVEQNRKNK